MWYYLDNSGLSYVRMVGGVNKFVDNFLFTKYKETPMLKLMLLEQNGILSSKSSQLESVK